MPEKNGNSVTFRWIAGILSTIIILIIAGYIARVDASLGSINRKLDIVIKDNADEHEALRDRVLTLELTTPAHAANPDSSKR